MQTKSTAAVPVTDGVARWLSGDSGAHLILHVTLDRNPEDGAFHAKVFTCKVKCGRTNATLARASVDLANYANIDESNAENSPRGLERSYATTLDFFGDGDETTSGVRVSAAFVVTAMDITPPPDASPSERLLMRRKSERHLSLDEFSGSDGDSDGASSLGPDEDVADDSQSESASVFEDPTEATPASTCAVYQAKPEMKAGARCEAFFSLPVSWPYWLASAGRNAAVADFLIFREPGLPDAFFRGPGGDLELPKNVHIREVANLTMLYRRQMGSTKLVLNPDKVKEDYDDVIYKFNTSYDFNDDVMGYGTISEGYRIGGLNLLEICDPMGSDVQTVCIDADEVLIEPDKTTNYELGVRSVLFDTLVLNAAIYYIEWDDVQVAGTTEVGTFPITVNGGSAESMGLELSSRWAATENLSFSGSYAYNEAELTDDAPGLVDGEDALDGDRLPGSPEHQYYLGAINRVGTEAPWNIGEFYGQSYFCDPRGQIVAEGSRDQDGPHTPGQRQRGCILTPCE